MRGQVINFAEASARLFEARKKAKANRLVLVFPLVWLPWIVFYDFLGDWIARETK